MSFYENKIKNKCEFIRETLMRKESYFYSSYKYLFIRDWKWNRSMTLVGTWVKVQDNITDAYQIEVALHIKKENPSLNRDGGYEIPKVYNLVLH